MSLRDLMFVSQNTLAGTKRVPPKVVCLTGNLRNENCRDQCHVKQKYCEVWHVLLTCVTFFNKALTLGC